MDAILDTTIYDTVMTQSEYMAMGLSANITHEYSAAGADSE
jgi:hypothetical protein